MKLDKIDVTLINEQLNSVKDWLNKEDEWIMSNQINTVLSIINKK